MLEQLFKCALVNIETTSLRIMQREFKDTREACADQRRPGLPVFYSLLYGLVADELQRREQERENENNILKVVLKNDRLHNFKRINAGNEYRRNNNFSAKNA